MNEERSVQEIYAPKNSCFGCGPANAKGLRIRSFPSPDDPEVLVCQWRAEPHHEAFPGMLNGGIVGALLDCHSNWAAAVHLMKKSGSKHPPCTVTAEFAVKMRRPTPTDGPITLTARIAQSKDDRAVVDAALAAEGKVRATCRGTFVAVEPGHPAYHRW